MQKRARQIARGLFFVTVFGLALHFGAAAAMAACPPPAGSNAIVIENCLAGNLQTEWDITGSGDPTIQGYATDISFNHGQTVEFKITTVATAYHIDIYRLGWYNGLGARKVATIDNTATNKTNQLACLADGNTSVVDCGDWSVSASWAIPATATSGIYIARLVREDIAGASHIVFIVRADSAHSDLLFQTSDMTWQAYNRYGGASLYFPDLRAYKVSYNRPFSTADYNQESWLFGPDYPMVRWLEANGYDVSYATGVDSARFPANLQTHRVFLSVGHDEYWSGEQRTNVEAARDFGVHLAFFSGNEIFWKTRWENNFTGIDFTGPTPYRTLVCYKETDAGARIDPLDLLAGVWTGTWRDSTFSPPADGGRPENQLTGTISMVNRDGTSTMEIPAADGKMRFWRNTSISLLAPGTIATLPFGVLGYEWDEDLDNGLRPAGQIRLSTTVRSGVQYSRDFGNIYTQGTATHHMTLHRRPSGALVFSAGNPQWTWGLDNDHNSGVSLPSQIPNPDARIQQATVNLFADMGAQPQSIQPGLALATASTDGFPPTSTISSPTGGATLPSGTQITIAGTAVDSAGGVVGGVEVSTDGGATWHPAVGRESWTYRWTPTATGAVTIRTRAADDSLNLETPSAGVTVNIGPPAPINCPCSLWSPLVAVGAQSDDNAPINLGVKFRSDLNGYITAIRFYKHPGNTGTHTAWLWTAPATGTGTLLATTTFEGESGSGWQEVLLNPPVAVTAGTTYIAAYHTPTGFYAASQSYFNGAGVDNPPLHALAENVQGSQGVFAYGAAGQYPTGFFGYTNYWVDVVFDTALTADTTPPTITATSPIAGSTTVNVSDNIIATFSEPMDPTTISSSTFALRDNLNNLVPASVTYTAATKTATLNPTSLLSFSKSYTAAVSGGSGGVKDLAGNALAADLTWTFNTVADTGCPCTLWNDSTIGGTDSNDPNAANLGMKFRSDVNGYILAIRFYKQLGNTGTTTAYLYTAIGSLLGSATFPAGTASGWQQVSLPSPVPINADTTYVAAYHTTAGHFGASRPYFAPAYVHTPLRALASGFDGPNGVYQYGPPSFPTNDPGDAANYWVDVIFDTTTVDHTAPFLTATSPANGATVVPKGTMVTATFSEPVDAATINSTNFELRDAASNLISAVVTYDTIARTATLDPTALLNDSATYTATIHGGAAGVKDIAGNAFAADQSWTFTTAAPTPTFTAGANVTVMEDSGAYNNTWATNITNGPVVFTVTTDNGALFSVAPAISPSGVLTFTPVPNTNGTATQTVIASNRTSAIALPRPSSLNEICLYMRSAITSVL